MYSTTATTPAPRPPASVLRHELLSLRSALGDALLLLDDADDLPPPETVEVLSAAEALQDALASLANATGPAVLN